MRGRRRTSCTGLAENGLPPATRGEARGFGPDPRLLKPERARRACLCGTQGGLGIGVAGWTSPSRQRAFGEGGRSVGGKSVRPCFGQPDEHLSRKTLAEGPKSRATTAERGAERCHIKLNLRGSFQRPVRTAKIPRITKGGVCLAVPSEASCGRPRPSRLSRADCAPASSSRPLLRGAGGLSERGLLSLQSPGGALPA